MVSPVSLTPSEIEIFLMLSLNSTVSGIKVCDSERYATRCVEQPQPPYFFCACPVGYSCIYCNQSTAPCSDDYPYCLMKNTERCIPPESPSIWTCVPPKCECKEGYQCERCNLTTSQCSEDSPYCLMKNTEKCIPQEDKNSCAPPTCVCLIASPCNQDMPYCIKANTEQCIPDIEGGCRPPKCVCKPGMQCEAPSCIEHATFNNSASQCINTCINPYASDSCPTSKAVAACVCNSRPKKYVYEEGRCVPYPEGCNTEKAKDQ